MFNKNSVKFYIVPHPKKITVEESTAVINPVVDILDNRFLPIKSVIEDTLKTVYGNTNSDGGIIKVKYDPEKSSEEYGIVVDRDIIITAGDYDGVCRAAAAVLQHITCHDGVLTAKKMVTEDKPDRPYRALMVDLARQWHPFETLLKFVDICFLYRLSCLHFHFSDNQGYRLPSKKYPKLNKEGLYYTESQIAYLNKYAAARGIQLLPEIDMPGHSSCFTGTYPEIFGHNPQQTAGVICLGKPEAIHAIEDIINECCDLFPNSKLIHLGGDEVESSVFEKCACCAAYMKENNIKSGAELYTQFLKKATDMVKARGRRPVLWEGFNLKYEEYISKDILLMHYGCEYHPQEMIRLGYEIVNASWKPLYITADLRWPHADIYNGWDLYTWQAWSEDETLAWPLDLKIKPTDRVLGAQISSWSNKFEDEYRWITLVTPAMCERVWSVERTSTMHHFRERLKHSNEFLSALHSVEKAAFDEADPTHEIK